MRSLLLTCVAVALLAAALAGPASARPPGEAHALDRAAAAKSR